MNKKIKYKKKLPIIILALITCLYFFNIIIAKNFLWEDFPIFYFPLKSCVFNSLKHGETPLWNSNLNLGYPIIADTTAAIFYPLNWLAVPFIKENISNDYFIIELWTILHLFLAGVFMYYLVDYLTQKNNKTRKQENKNAINPAALFAAIAFMFSGFFIGHLKHVAQTTTACWLPLIFLFLYKSFKEKKYSCAIYAGIFWGISILSGHPQIVYHFSFFLGLFILWEIINNFINKKNYKKIIMSSIVAIIIAASLSAVQILPFLEFLKTSTRNSVSDGFASSFSLKPTEFITNLILPHTFGGFKPHTFYFGSGGAFWETAIYVGILTLILALIAIIKDWDKNNLIFFLIFSSLLCLSLAFGGYSFVHPLLLNILPGLNMIRAPVRFILPVIFSICILSGFGFDYFTDFFRQLRKKTKNGDEQIISKFSKLLKICAITNLSFLIFLLYLNFSIETSGLLSSLIAFSVIFLIILILIYLYLIKKINTKLFFISLIFLIFFDMFLFGWQFNNGTIKPEEYYPQNKITELLQAPSLPSSRIINDNYLMPNSAYVYSAPIMESNHYMMIKDYYNFTDGLSENLYYQNQFRDFNNFFTNKTKLNLLGIKYIISERDFLKWFPKVGKNVYKNNDAIPRFVLSKKSVSEKEPEKILGFLNNPEYDPKQTIYIEKDYQKKSEPPLENSGEKSQNNNIKIEKYEEEYIKLEIENSDSAWLLANEIYYPGWQAKIDGQPVEIYKANYTFRAIPIETGKHVVELSFKPKSYFIGKIISLFTVLILLMMGIFNFIRKKQKG